MMDLNRIMGIIHVYGIVSYEKEYRMKRVLYLIS